MKVMVIVKATKESEAGVMPSRELLAAMGRFNEELARASVMLAGEGLQPSAKGVRVRFPEGTVTDGPFAETKELIAGYWLWQVASMQEAIDWLRRSPFREHPEGEVEIRPVFTAEDFGEDLAPEIRAQEERIAFVAAGRHPQPSACVRRSRRRGSGPMRRSGMLGRKEPRMAIAEEFRRLALALAGTTEAPHVDRRAFRVARIFATLAPDGATANLRLAPDEQELRCLLQPAAFAPVPTRWGAQGWTTVRLDAIALPELQCALGRARRRAQPRGLRTKRREKTG